MITHKLPSPPPKLRSMQPFMWTLFHWMSMMGYPGVEELKVKIYKSTKQRHRRQVMAEAFRIIACEARCYCAELPHYPECPMMVLAVMESWAHTKWSVTRLYNQRSPHQALLGEPRAPEPIPMGRAQTKEV